MYFGYRKMDKLVFFVFFLLFVFMSSEIVQIEISVYREIFRGKLQELVFYRVMWIVYGVSSYYVEEGGCGLEGRRWLF